MNAVLTFDNGEKVVADIVRPLPRHKWETQQEYEQRFIQDFNSAGAAHKIIKVHITRN